MAICARESRISLTASVCKRSMAASSSCEIGCSSARCSFIASSMLPALYSASTLALEAAKRPSASRTRFRNSCWSGGLSRTTAFRWSMNSFLAVAILSLFESSRVSSAIAR